MNNELLNQIEIMITNKEKFITSLNEHTLEVIDEKFSGTFEYEKIAEAYELWLEGWKMSQQNDEAIELYADANKYIELFVENYID